MWKTTWVWLAALGMASAGLEDQAHPRLWLTRSGEPELRAKIAGDPLAAELQASVLAEAVEILTERTCKYDIPDGKRLLFESRRALRNVMHCAWAWRTGAGEKFRERTLLELEAACALKDWNPSHFLDVAEMATAVAMGYDWLYPTLTPEQRAMCEKALIEKALLPAKRIFEGKGAWSKPGNNWSQVCGAGISLAAAALAGSDQGLSEGLFKSGLSLVEACGKFYQPDGMYPEGPGYWHYGTNFHVMLLAACAPMDRSISEDPILGKAGGAIMHLTSPTRLGYNFADGNAGREIPSPAQCWLASHYKDGAQARYVRGLFHRALAESGGVLRGDRYFPLSILWLPEDPVSAEPLPSAAVFNGQQSIAIFRSGWDARAAWLAIKGGTPAASHGHMDVGSFAYDLRGSRWFHDLGMENYNLPGYFGKQRWKYYRLQNRSHNTLEIDGNLQNPGSAPCPLVSSTVQGPLYSASFDLSGAYEGSASKVIRIARFDSRGGAVRLEDDITAPSGPVVWRAFTKAAAEIQGHEVVLTQDGDRITLRRVSESGTWSIAPATPPTAEENQNEGFRAVTLTVPKAGRVSIVVEIRP